MIINSDCLSHLKTMPDNSVDSIITDPPYGLSFMGKKWDYDVPSQEIWEECLRVLKPGGHLLSFAGTRTYHRIAVAIEDAGFEVRDMIEWVYGSGFPKSLNIGKAVDKLQGNEREVVGIDEDFLRRNPNNIHKDDFKESYGNPSFKDGENAAIRTRGTSDWEGWGTALKPAHEPICMARKPLVEKTVAENCLKYGTGGINIDESRVETIDKVDARVGHSGFPVNKATEPRPLVTQTQGRFPANLIHDNSEEVRECFPETKSGGGNKIPKKDDIMFGSCRNNIRDEKFMNTEPSSGNASRFFKSIEDDPLQEWAEKEVAEHREEILEDMEKEYGIIKGKSIIYQAKASKSERNKGCEGLEEKTGSNRSKVVYRRVNRVDLDAVGDYIKKKRIEKGISLQELNNKFGYVAGCNWWESKNPSNQREISVEDYKKLKTTLDLDDRFDEMLLNVVEEEPKSLVDTPLRISRNNHPTVKPIALMEYLIKMVTPKGGVVLDPFMGSGTTGVACRENGFDFIGIEMDEEYFKIAEARITV